MSENQNLAVKIELNSIEAFNNAKEKQMELVKNNPFVEITDNKTYSVAKKHRTALRQGRYELQNGEKVIKQKLKEFLENVKNETVKLIDITREHENKQQAEIERYEAVKKAEKEEKERIEKERIQNIKNSIIDFRRSYQDITAKSTIKDIDDVVNTIEQHFIEAQEFQSDFDLVKEQLIDDAKKRKEFLLEEQRLQAEREKQEAERKKIEAKRKAEEEKLKAEREALEKERKAIEAEKAKQRAKEEAERKAKEEAEANKLKAQKELDVAREEYVGLTGKKADETLTVSQIKELIKNHIEAEKKKADELHQAKFKEDKATLLKTIASLNFDFEMKYELKNKESVNLVNDLEKELNALCEKYVNLTNNL